MNAEKHGAGQAVNRNPYRKVGFPLVLLVNPCQNLGFLKALLLNPGQNLGFLKVFATKPRSKPEKRTSPSLKE